MIRWLRRLLRARIDTRVVRLDPHVRVWAELPPARSEAYWDRLWASGLAANAARRQARADRDDLLPAFLQRQAD